MSCGHLISFSIRVLSFFGCSIFKRSLSDGQILHESNTPRLGISPGQSIFHSTAFADGRLQEGANRYICDSLLTYESLSLGFDMWRTSSLPFLLHYKSCLASFCDLTLGTHSLGLTSNYLMKYKDKYPSEVIPAITD